MATENIPRIDKLFKCFGQQSKTDFEKINKQLKELGESIKKFRESEEKSMLHNVTVSEDKVLEEYWCIRAIKEDFNNAKKVVGEMKCTSKPTLNEIATFLKNSGGDFASVVQNYRFEDKFRCPDWHWTCDPGCGTLCSQAGELK